MWEGQVNNKLKRLTLLAPWSRAHEAFRALDGLRALSLEGFFSFLYLKKIKISKIYGGFEKFQNYTPVAPCLDLVHLP